LKSTLQINEFNIYFYWFNLIRNEYVHLNFRFVGGQINACYNAVDRHIKAGKGKKVALIHDSPVTKSVTKLTYEELYEKVCTCRL